MSELSLTQTEADNLLFGVEKQRMGNSHYLFPSSGQKIEVPIISLDKKYEFLLSLFKGKIAIEKVTYHTRVRKTIILARIDIGGASHMNPDGTEVPCPHMHLYTEGFGTKIAKPLPDMFDKPFDKIHTLDQFMEYCKIVLKPYIDPCLLP
jgi:hypothetical protein